MKNKGRSESFIDHFYDKLLHIECPSSAADNKFFREEYARRKTELEDFLLEACRTNFELIEQQVSKLA